MLKRIPDILVVFCSIVFYLQDVLEFESDLRKDFYFIGNAIFKLGVSYIFLRDYRSNLTIFFFFFMVGNLANEILFENSLNDLEFFVGLICLIINVFLNLLPAWRK